MTKGEMDMAVKKKQIGGMKEFLITHDIREGMWKAIAHLAIHYAMTALKSCGFSDKIALMPAFVCE